MYPNLSDLRYFIEISSTGNVSQAALRLGVTQPTLSLALNRLEDCVGTKLFQRSKKGVSLTPAGRSLLSQSKKLIQDWEAIQSKSLANHTEVKGQFTLGCHPSVALYSLPQCLPDLLTQYSDLEITLVHDLSRKILDGIVAVDIDIGIVVNPVRHPDLIIKTICHDEVSFWTSSKRKNIPKDILICDPELMQTQDLLRKIKKTGYEFNRRVRSSNLEVVAELTEAGAGVGVLPGRVAARYPHLQMLKGLPTFKDEISVVYRAESRAVKAVQIIADELVKALNG